MFLNYFRTAFRNLKRDLWYLILNILGLSLGIACCLLCFLHIKYESSYDHFHSQGEQIYRITAGDPSGKDDYWAKMAPPVSGYLKDQFPEIKEFARVGNISWNPKVQVNYKENQFNEELFLLADPAFFDIFDFRLIEGNPERALSDLNSVVISEQMAKKYFGNEPALGNRIEVDGKYSFEVSGVIENAPANSHLNYNFIAPFENVERVFHEGALQSWGEYNYFAYLLLDDQANAGDLQEKIHQVVIPVSDEQKVALDGVYIQPLYDIHFSDSRGNQKQAYDATYIVIFSLIAISVLLIAAINFINLSTARSSRRVIEVGIRKAIGASRWQLMGQFIAETLLTTLAALIVGLVIISAVLPTVNQVLDSEISFIGMFDRLFVGISVAITVLLAIASGGYIAFFITSFDASRALKGASRTRPKGFTTRDLLLITQFAVSVVLIISSIFLTRQLYFIQSKNLGLNKEQVITVPIYNRSVQSKIETLKTELLRSAEITAASASSFTAGNANWNQTVWWEGQEEEESMFILAADADFVETLQLDLLEGDLNGIKQLPADEIHYILNRSAVEQIGWDSGVGNMFTAFGDRNKHPVAGVVDDYNFRSLHHTVSPTVIAISSNFNLDQMLIRVRSYDDLETNLEFIRTTFAKVIPEIPFEYGFLDEDFGKLYKEEQRAEMIVETLTTVTIVIALFGLFAMASFSMQERTKEVAIRKVIGITTPNLILLLMKKYLWLLLISNVIAWPFAWFISNHWIQQFPYRIALEWWVFALGTMVTMLLVVAIVGGKALRTAEINPVESLRND